MYTTFNLEPCFRGGKRVFLVLNIIILHMYLRVWGRIILFWSRSALIKDLDGIVVTAGHAIALHPETLHIL